MENDIAEIMKRLIACIRNMWVEMMLLMDDPPLTKISKIYEKVVTKSSHGSLLAPMEFVN